MESLRPIQLSPNSAVVSWKVPFNLGLFPPGLEFRATYQILSTWANVNVFYVSFILLFHRLTSFCSTIADKIKVTWSFHLWLSVDFNLFRSTFLFFFLRSFDRMLKLLSNSPGIPRTWIISWPWRCHMRMPSITSPSGLDLQLQTNQKNVSGRQRPLQFSVLNQTVSYLNQTSTLLLIYLSFSLSFLLTQALAVLPLLCQTASKLSIPDWSNVRLRCVGRSLHPNV